MHYRKNWMFASMVISAGLICAQPSFAGFGNLASGLTGNKTASGPSAKDLTKSLKKLNNDFDHAWKEMITAEAETMAALDDQADADKLTAAANALEGKTDTDSLQKKIEISQDATKTVDAKLASSAKLNDAAKKKLTEAVIHYGFGIVAMVRLPASYQEWVKNAQSSVTGNKDPMSAIGGGLSLAQEIPAVVKISASLPDLLSAWGSTTHKFITFAKGNDVDTGDLASKI